MTPDPNDQPPGRPTGKALLWSPEEAAALSKLDAGDAAEARDLWREHVGKGMRTLLDAEVDDGK